MVRPQTIEFRRGNPTLLQPRVLGSQRSELFDLQLTLVRARSLAKQARAGITFEPKRDLTTKLRESLAQFVAAARRSGGRASGGRRVVARATSRRGGGTDRTADIREWARSNGYTVSDRGRIASNIVEAYEKAH